MLDRCSGGAYGCAAMHIVKSRSALEWGKLDLPLFGISSSWDGASVSPAAAWCVAIDGERLWFVASHGKPAHLHPASRPRRFLAGLWEHDLAELFLSDPSTGRYLELNLAPNAAWWSCEFSSPRQRVDPDGTALPGVETFAELAPSGGWIAAMSVPLEVLRERIGFGEGIHGNVTFILESPEPRYLTLNDLGGGTPDYHRPDRFPKVRFVDGDLSALPPGR